MEDFILYKEAVALKEIGFNEPCVAYFTMATEKLCRTGSNSIGAEFTEVKLEDIYKDYSLAPTWRSAFKWFRDNHGLWFRPDYPFDDKLTYSGSIHELGRYSAKVDLDEHDSAEEVDLDCLRKLIEIVK